MNTNVSRLFKKELYELLFNYKSILGVTVVSLIPYALKAFGIEDVAFFACLFNMMIISQYVYDSYMSDIKDGGALFLYNVHAGFACAFGVKLCVGICIGVYVFAINAPNWLGAVRAADFLWILPFFVFSSIIMQLFSVFAKGAEMTAAVLATLVLLAVLGVCFLLPFVAVKVAVLVVADAWLFLLCKKLSGTVFYRAQL